MSQHLLSGSPEDDDQLPSFIEQKLKSLGSAASTSAGTPERKDTQSPRPSAQGHSHSHPHAHQHQHSHSHSHAHNHNHNHSHPHSHSPNASQSRTWSLASSSSLGVPGSSHDRPPSRSMSRTPSHEYRETLDAKSKDLEDGSRIINQYKITEVIGRGAYGTVRKAILTDDPSVQFAVKEFGKTRLRKTHRAVSLRKPQRRNPLGMADRSDPSHAQAQAQDESKDPLTHIRHEIAILKKLHHPHVVQLYEVLDDPSKDSLYMVFEYCPDGTVIDIKLNQRVQPLPEDVARLYFVQVLMGIEYLHENEIVHRDIKPDNILLSNDRKTCKIVDFGVSEMFIKPGDDTMQKSAGSPAFMSPELCTAGHAEYHGKSDDIWSFGVTLYCMCVGHLPFQKDNFYEMYEAIKNDEPELPPHLSSDLADLLRRMLAKDPERRITVPEMRQHAWTQQVDDGILLSKDDNLEKVVSEITDEDLDCAICKITNIFTFARAISRFKKGGSVNRARREASRSTSGSSNRDSSWFPPTTPSPDKPSRAATRETSTHDDEPSADVATIKEETPTPGGYGQAERQETPRAEPNDAAEVEELQSAAACMFDSPQMHTFELPHQEPDGNGPLQRNRSGPIATLHRDTSDAAEPPVITTESPRSASPEIFSSPASTQLPAFQRSASDTDDVAAQMASMDVHAYSSPGKDGEGPRHAQSVQERAASLGKKPYHPKPKLLPDQPTFKSPRNDTLDTPPGASELYAQSNPSAEQSAHSELDDNPYFAAAKNVREAQDKPSATC